MRIRILAFTEKGFVLAKRLEAELSKALAEALSETPSEAPRKYLSETPRKTPQKDLQKAPQKNLRGEPENIRRGDESAALAEEPRVLALRCGQPYGLAEWTDRYFGRDTGLIFVGAAGIAVRAIAPHIRDKASDPAVVVMDECGRHAIPILSGHLGGANDLARLAGRLCDAVPVLTTATDVNGVFAVDEWAKRQNCAVLQPERIRQVSAKLLSGGTVRVRSAWPVAGEPPAGIEAVSAEAEKSPTAAEADVVLTLEKENTGALCLVPRIAVLGIGCRRGISRQAIEEAFASFLEQENIREQAICKVCSIDLKKEEPGILEFCRSRGLPYETWSAGCLEQVEGSFSASAFVQSVTGVDNVCERSAVQGAGPGGRLWKRKHSENGVTLALALEEYRPDWRWQDE